MREKQIFDYWVKVMGKDPKRAILNAKRKKAIKDRLDEGYTVERIMAAIRGCRGNKYNMGQNKSKTAYNDIELICRNGVKLEGYEAMNEPIKQEGNHNGQSHAQRSSREASTLLAHIAASENNDTVLGDDEPPIPAQMEFDRGSADGIQGWEGGAGRELPFLVREDLDTNG